MITINDIQIDLKQIDIDFDLNQDQIDALNKLAEFLEDDKVVTASLVGSAGTGKTLCVRVLLEYISLKYHQSLGVILAAPTHKAKIVLKRLSGPSGVMIDEPTTVHRLLGLKPIINIVEFDAKDIEFDLSSLNLFSFGKTTLVIIDEGSLINDNVYDLLVEKIGAVAKIIFLGDDKQLIPVKQAEKSKVFTSTDFPTITLTKVERQVEGNPLLETLTVLRSTKLASFQTNINDQGVGLEATSDVKDFLRQIGTNFKSQNFKFDPLHTKVLCYTNKRVGQFNLAIRKMLGYDKFINEGEILMANDNYDGSSCAINQPFIQYEGHRLIKKANLYNANDYIVEKIDSVKGNIPYFNEVDGYQVLLRDTVDDMIYNIFLIDPEAPVSIYASLASVLENTRLRAIDKYTPSYSKKNYWSMYYAMMGSFTTMYDLIYQGRTVKKATFNHGYAITIHRSQGSSYENTFIDMKDILSCPSPGEIRSLQYVALSRTRRKATILI